MRNDDEKEKIPEREGTARAKAVSEETERRPVRLGSPSQEETGVEMNTEEAGPGPAGTCSPQRGGQILFPR